MRSGETGDGKSNALTQDRKIAKVEKVSVYLHGHLLRYSGGRIGPIRTSVQSGETLRDLIAKLKIPPDEIGITAINGCPFSTLEAPVLPGDEVKLFGLVGGG